MRDFFWKKIPVSIIFFYQYFLSFDRGVLSLLAPGGACLRSPTCSEYTKNMIIKKGAIQGLILGLKRIYKCR